jgi:hypothetical protein
MVATCSLCLCRTIFATFLAETFIQTLLDFTENYRIEHEISNKLRHMSQEQLAIFEGKIE